MLKYGLLVMTHFGLENMSYIVYEVKGFMSLAQNIQEYLLTSNLKVVAL